ncbi:MAG: hypothetical protein GY807_22590 [Gammaproteobacteria bacterium]|nr:hypothetical protein [Gammaproteobacteria bacterium]
MTKRNKATYDLPPELKQSVYDLAVELGIPISSVAAAVIAVGMKQVSRSDLQRYIIPSSSPLHKNKFDIEQFIKDQGL